MVEDDWVEESVGEDEGIVVVSSSGLSRIGSKPASPREKPAPNFVNSFKVWYSLLSNGDKVSPVRSVDVP